MAKIKFHQVAAVAVLVGFAVWMGTGTFSSVGSAAAEGEGAAQPATPAPVDKVAAPRTVGIVVPPRVQHARAIRIAGQTEPDKRAIIATRAAGIVSELPISEGDHVTKGQKLLALDPEDKPAMIELAKQVVKQRQAELEAAQRLAKNGTMPKLQLDTAISALSQAQSQLTAAQADLDRLTVYAPFDGVIDSVEVELGSSVGQGVGGGGQIATLISLNPVVVKGEISERDLRYATVGHKAEAVLVNGEKIEGVVRYISREATAATRTFRVEVAVDNPDDKIPAGMTAEILVRAEATDSVVLPRSVVTLGSNGDLGIRAVDKDNKVVFYPIDLVDDLQQGLVLGGIPADARVIVAGQDLVADGDTVTPVQIDEATMRKIVGEPASLN